MHRKNILGRVYSTLLKDGLSLKGCIIKDLNLLPYTFLYCLKFCPASFYYFNSYFGGKNITRFKALTSLYPLFPLPRQSDCWICHVLLYIWPLDWQVTLPRGLLCHTSLPRSSNTYSITYTLKIKMVYFNLRRVSINVFKLVYVTHFYFMSLITILVILAYGEDSITD